MTKTYSITQIIEVDNDGNTRIVSNTITEIGNPNLFEYAKDYLSTNHNLFTNTYKLRISSRYIGYKKVGDSQYSLILHQKQDGIYVSVPASIIEHYICFNNNVYSTKDYDYDYVFVQDKLFPYAMKTFASSKLSIKNILDALIHILMG